MATEVKVPVLPESVSDATIASWHKKAGEAVKRDENLVDLETDKVVLEVPSPVDGVLKEIKFEAGSTVTSNQILAIIEEGAVAAPHRPKRRRPMPRRRPLRLLLRRHRLPLPLPRRLHRSRLLTACRRVRVFPPSPRAWIRRRSTAPAVVAR